MYSIDELNAKNVAQLKDIAKEIGAKIKSNDNKKTIVYAILDTQAETPVLNAAAPKATEADTPPIALAKGREKPKAAAVPKRAVATCTPIARANS